MLTFDWIPHLIHIIFYVAVTALSLLTLAVGFVVVTRNVSRIPSAYTSESTQRNKNKMRVSSANHGSGGPGKISIWTIPGCLFCTKATELLIKAKIPHTRRKGGIKAFMGSSEFEVLLREWKTSEPDSTPFRSTYPVIVHESSQGKLTMIGGLGNLNQWIATH